ncbi:type I-C CRISPR-associated protein Cas8c/Csd1 [Micromonospora zhanjiangensis]|uniref:Type I-C CRISPR-associated protein Cas8c/Csd1 n=1 Tax=Micromonospora zhanjiangensis TaxID=1522057 RepID=A0ABV8KPT9_9ACTN
MLLQRLVQYADSSDDVDPPFYARKPVRWLLDITGDGSPAGALTDTAQPKEPGRKFGVPRAVPAVTRTVGVAPALAVDTVEYVFGWVDEAAKPDRVAKQRAAFRELTKDWAAAEPDGPAAAVDAFYRDGHDQTFEPPEGWKRSDLVAFRVDGELACAAESAIRYWATVAGGRKGSGQSGLCLVCGQDKPLLKTIPLQVPQRWLPGATQGASLVSINASVHGYELQKFLGNTPICLDCGLKFMSAFTTLLSSERHSTTLSGQNARLAWWVVGGSIFDPMGPLDQPNETDIQDLLAGPATGERGDLDENSTYCSVTVGGNVARVMVRDWVELPVPRIKENIRQWFDDHEIVDQWTGEVTRIRLVQLARAAGRWQRGRGGGAGSWAQFGSSGEDRPAGIYNALLRSALLRQPLPPKLLTHVINRIRQDGRLDPARVGLIRLALRRHPSLTKAERERLTPTLNLDNPTPAYLSGRIFAVLDELQRTVSHAAKQPLNTTFAEKYFGRAITNPQAVLVAGERTAVAWLRRLRGPLKRPTWANAYQRRLDDLYAQLPQIPSGAVLAEKANFILGYHQQRAAMQAERTAAAAAKKSTDLPPTLDEVAPETEGAAV